MQDEVGDELVIALVGAIGTNLLSVSVMIEECLRELNYNLVHVPLVETLAEYPEFAARLKTERADERYKNRMDCGNEFRKRLGIGQALAWMGVAAIRNERARVHQNEDRPLPRTAFVLRSLKTPEEVEALRNTYRENLIVVSAFSSKSARVKQIAKKIAQSINDSDSARHEAAAISLVLRDQIEPGNDFGQNVRDTFPMADVFVDATHDEQSRATLRRFFSLLFGHPVVTPTRDEFGMFQAYGAALRSSAGRQVGAAIADREGDIVAIGTNEVAKAFGGQYWEEDGSQNDHRDHTRVSPNKAMVDSILADLFARLQTQKWLKGELLGQSPESLVQEAKSGSLLKPMGEDVNGRGSLSDTALLSNIIEFFRAVHAEMAALMSAARRGVPVQNCTLYSTTFPCHECARHLVASGIRRVLFVEPYPKSKVSELYDDSISIDGESLDTKVQFQPFVGIAPRRYLSMFLCTDRGTKSEWERKKREQSPKGTAPFISYGEREKELATLLNEALTINKLSLTEIGA